MTDWKISRKRKQFYDELQFRKHFPGAHVLISVTPKKTEVSMSGKARLTPNDLIEMARIVREANVEVCTESYA